MARADLLALTEDGLTQMANVGLVKRGRRDLAAGLGPTLTESADGAVEARFADGTITRLPADRPPADAHCTCPASGLCRHRVILVLAYQQQAAGTGAATPATWDPGGLDGAAFEVALPREARAELTRLLASSVTVRLERGPVPVARLPMATVHFLAPHDLGYAHCDCVARTGCAHVALALRAFREADGAGEVTLSSAAAPAQPRPVEGIIGAVDAVLARLLTDGIVAGRAAHERGLTQALRVAAAEGATWLVLALEGLVEQVAAYEDRSTRYDEAEVLALAAELYARTRAADARAALGQGQPLETAMAKTRLVSLGARVWAHGRELVVRALLADVDTGTALLTERRFGPVGDGAGPRPGPDGIGDHRFAPGLAIGAVARGQIVTSVARRRADGVVVFGAGGRGKTTLMPRAAAPRLPSPLRVASAPALMAEMSRRPPALIRPRNRVLDLHVFEIDQVLGQCWSPGAHVWRAAVTLTEGGGRIDLERSHDAGAPRSLATLFAAFDHRYGPITQLAGTVRVTGGALVCEPWSLATGQQLIVPDLADTEPPDTLIAVAGAADAATPAELAHRFLAGILHTGRRHLDPQRADQGRDVIRALRCAGFETSARQIEAWLGAPASDVAAFGQVAVWFRALLE